MKKWVSEWVSEWNAKYGVPRAFTFRLHDDRQSEQIILSIEGCCSWKDYWRFLQLRQSSGELLLLDCNLPLIDFYGLLRSTLQSFIISIINFMKLNSEQDQIKDHHDDDEVQTKKGLRNFSTWNRDQVNRIHVVEEKKPTKPEEEDGGEVRQKQHKKRDTLRVRSFAKRFFSEWKEQFDSVLSKSWVREEVLRVCRSSVSL